VGLEFETVWVVEVAGPDGVAPLSSPCEAGSKYVVAEIVAVTCGEFAAWPNVIALSDISRPLTHTL
jgi:hypothetical protein